MSRLTEEKKQALASQGIDFSIHPAIEKGIQELITSGKSTYSTPEAIESFKASKSEWAQKFVDFAQNPQDIIANHNNHITIQNTLFALSLFLNSTDDMRKFLKSLT